MAHAKKLLRLDSITLRGIGSYFNGAELRLRPLTILCGKNGSGKSTWLSTIDLLQRSSKKGMLPFAFDASDHDCHNMQLTNARLSNAAVEELNDDSKADAQFGPRGTIGLNSTAMSPGSLFDRADTATPFDPIHPAAKLLWLGSCEKGARFCLRVAHSSDGMNEYHQDCIDIVFDGAYRIRMVRPPPADAPREPRQSPYVLECSRAFLSADASEDIVKVLRFDMRGPHGNPQVIESLVVLPDELSGEALLERCIKLSRSLWEHTLEGFFRITAIRDRQEISSLENSRLAPSIPQLVTEVEQPPEEGNGNPRLTAEQLIQTIRDRLNALKVVVDERVAARYVGPHGESALALWRHFSENTVGASAQVVASAFTTDISKNLRNLLGVEVEDPPESEATDLWRFKNACLIQPQGPGQLSSGFHQVMPIVVQAALMQHGEILAVENPEVHLHPSLQLAMAKFLMDRAKEGKTILVETHSDLILRRLIRAILEEELPQQSLNIQFVSLRDDGGEAGITHSISERLKTDERGQIGNWPEGFLDDDIKESRRLFRIMYGTLPDDDEDGADD